MIKKYLPFSYVLAAAIAIVVATTAREPSADSRLYSSTETADQLTHSQVETDEAMTETALSVKAITAISDGEYSASEQLIGAVATAAGKEDPNRPSKETLDKFGSQKSQDMFAASLRDSESFFEWVAMRYEEGLSDKKAIARNELAVAQHIEKVLADTDVQLTLSCSKSVCYIDIEGGREDVRLFATSFGKGWPATEEFMSTFGGYRLDDGTNRTVVYLEDI